MKKYLKNRKAMLGVIFIIFLIFAGWAYYAYANRVMPQSAIYLLNDIQPPKAGDKILIFSPHPDDETIAVGGYIYDAEKDGAQVKIVLVTDGNKQGLRDKRYAEFKKATGLLGIKSTDLIFLGHPDGSLNKIDENILQKEFQMAINDFQPNIVFYPYPHDDHPDHARTGQIADKALQNSAVLSYQYLVHANYFPQPQTYHPNDYLLPPIKLVTFDSEWRRYMISPATQMKQKEASEAYKSQMKNPLIRELFYSMIRQNELFAVNASNSGGN